ncbi:hypothetical protein N7492_007438 [Penicillium capsulatum]|uniref:Uncharacterized protein n=1 Tax=Penicillium capsulatum TaxID=69766 RepID=A0A9W9LM25_9EURO|nr:hypothetical protein N7492_007438 [Penicillium capsulatum]KAJ6117273.1 hypothetical protein N7512_006998 [Penicillium capsulatum]
MSHRDNPVGGDPCGSSSSSRSTCEPGVLTVGERDPPMSREWLREQGTRVMRWIESTGEPCCPIPPQALTFEQVEQDVEVKVGEDREFPPDLREIPHEPGVLPGQAPCRTFHARYRQVFWAGMTAPGLIIIQNITRERTVGTGQPHSTELALAFYLRDHPIESLRHVFVTGVMNAQTRAYLEKHLYGDLWPRDGNKWKKGTREYRDLMPTQVLEHGSEHFEALMGTRIGRTVAYLVLGGFPRGTRRILVYVVHVVHYHFEFRFDLEPIA